MYNFLLSLLFVSSLSISFSVQALELRENFGLCINGLSVLEKEVENIEGLDKKGVAALRGTVLLDIMQNEDIALYKTESTIYEIKDDILNLRYCTTYGLSLSDISLVMNITTKKISYNDVIDLITDCEASLMFYGGILEKQIGEKMAYHVAFHLGKKMGKKKAFLDILFGRRFLDDKITKTLKAKIYSLDAPDEQASLLLDKMSGSCEVIGIPLDTAYYISRSVLENK